MIDLSPIAKAIKDRYPERGLRLQLSTVSDHVIIVDSGGWEVGRVDGQEIHTAKPEQREQLFFDAIEAFGPRRDCE